MVHTSCFEDKSDGVLCRWHLLLYLKVIVLFEISYVVSNIRICSIKYTINIKIHNSKIANTYIRHY